MRFELTENFLSFMGWSHLMVCTQTTDGQRMRYFNRIVQTLVGAMVGILGQYSDWLDVAAKIVRSPAVHCAAISREGVISRGYLNPFRRGISVGMFIATMSSGQNAQELGNTVNKARIKK